MSDVIIDKIQVYKEILTTFPQNNEKNIEKYISKVEEILEEYNGYKQKILNEINTRYNTKINMSENKNIEELKRQIENYQEILEVINETKTPYEKTNLDKEIYRLGRYYKENLENVNNQIMICINIFRNMGINISCNDFNYSKYAKEYMDIFLQEMKIGDINSSTIKSKFEDLYWKCPEIITHIEIIIKNIYLKNEKRIEKYFENKKNNILNKYKINEEEIKEKCQETKRELQKEISNNKKIIIQKFINKELNIKDYTDDKIEKIYQKVLNEKSLEKITNKDYIDETNKNVIKFINSIYEYKNYIKYKFIFDTVKQNYKEVEKYKNENKKNLKKINEYQKQLSKLNNKSLFTKKENKDVKINTIFAELKNEYKEYLKNGLYTNVLQKINDDTTIYNVLEYASYFYNLLVEAIIKQFPNIEQNDIDEYIKEFKEFMEFPYFTILNNIHISEDKDILMIIKDRYKLLDFNVEKEDLEIDNIDTLLDNLTKIYTRHCIDNAGLTIKEIESICEYDKILHT